MDEQNVNDVEDPIAHELGILMNRQKKNIDYSTNLLTHWIKTKSYRPEYNNLQSPKSWFLYIVNIRYYLLKHIATLASAI